jgi:PAS domain S-box-containing protein
VLGSFAIYHRFICHPRLADKRIVDMATHIATIAIQAERAQQNLQHQLFFLQQLVDTIPCPIFFKDAAGRYLGGNRSYENLIGLSRDQFIGKTVYDVAPKELADKYQAADQALFDHPGNQAYEALLRDADGAVRNIMFHKATFSNADGSLGGLVGVILDITEVKRAEARWNMAAREAEIANRAKSNFLAQMSHELRTPLNAIIGFSEAMKLEYFGPMTNPFYQSYAADIHESGHLLLSLINDILDLSKIEAGKQPLVIEPLDLHDVVLGALHLVERHAREAQVSLTLDMAEQHPDLKADRRAVIRIILNLLSNAIKFTPAGGQIILRCAVRDQGVSLAVIDTGIGMSREQIPVALSAFGQLNNAYTRGHQGTGLGLPMVKALAEQHGGTLRIDSAPGKGTTVTVWLPHVARPPVSEDEATLSPSL